MSRKYCVYWFPTVFHKELDLITHYLRPRELDDDQSSFRLTVELRIITEGSKGSDDYKENIEITLKGKTFAKPLNVTLYQQFKSHNGFRCYYYDFPPNRISGEDAHFENLLKVQIYHYAKEFYHSHEVLYGEEKDCFLEAIIKPNDIKINGQDNEPIINFLKQFANRFYFIAHEISEMNSVVIDIENDSNAILAENPNKEGKQIVYENEALYKKKAQAINRACEDALIEHTYCKTLLFSIYNNSFRTICNDRNDRSNDEYRKLAINIENSINYIECIKYKNANRVNDVSLDLLERINVFNSTSKRSLTLSISLAIFSAAFALLSLSIVKDIWFFGNKKEFWSSLDSFNFCSITILAIFFIFFIYFAINGKKKSKN